MRRVLSTLVLAIVAIGVAAWLPRGEQVPLKTRAMDGQTCCLLSFSVVDVIADSSSGAPIDKATGGEFTWPAGYTAWRAGTETEVRDGWGNVVLRTGGRYRFIPTWPDGAIGEVQTCSACELGYGPL